MCMLREELELEREILDWMTKYIVNQHVYTVDICKRLEGHCGICTMLRPVSFLK